MSRERSSRRGAGGEETGRRGRRAPQPMNVVPVIVGVAVVVVLVAVIGWVLMFPSGFGDANPGGPPPHLPIIDAFEQAWNASDYAAIGAQLRALKRERVQTWLEGLAEKRGWGDGLPRLSNREILTDDLDSTLVAARIALADPPGGELTVRWELHGEEWKLTMIRPPRE